MKQKIAVWASFTALCFQACSHPSYGSKSTHKRYHREAAGSEGSQESNQREAEAFHEIESLFSKGLFDTCETKLAAFARKYPHGNLRASTENLYGLLLLQHKKQYDSAILHFRKAILLSNGRHDFQQYVYYNLATAQYENGQFEEARKSLGEIDLGSLDKSNKIKVYILRATIYGKISLPVEASRQLLLAGNLLSESDGAEANKNYLKLLNQTLPSVKDTRTLEQLYKEFEGSIAADTVLFQLSVQEALSGNKANSDLHLHELIQKYPQSSYFAQAQEMLSRTSNQTPIENGAVGVLLPLKGKFSKFGQKSLQGIQLAFGVFNSQEPDSQLSLVIEDSGDETEQAIKALDRLVLKHHVIAVIGPMLSKGVDQISQRAQELGVPLLSLSRRAGAPQDFLFQAGLTQQIQTYEIARHAIEDLGAKRFAIIYPNEKMGIEISQSFWDAVDSLGGKIVGYESYNPGETDFRQAVDRLSGLHYSDARHRELALLAEEREANHITKRTRKTEQFFQLKPIVDYDAVFIPDEPKIAGQILPTFAYRDVEKIKFLGTAAWNSSDFISRIQGYTDQTTFVDAFFPEEKSSMTQNFITRFKETFGQDPSSFEAIAYDAANLLRYVLTSSSSLSREDLRDKLKDIRSFAGVTGEMTYKNGQYYRDLKLLTIKNGQFVQTKSKSNSE